MTHIHSRFSDEQLKLLIRSYEEGQMSPAQDLNFLLGLKDKNLLFPVHDEFDKFLLRPMNLPA